MARLATRMMLGESLESLGLKDKVIPYHGAKEGRTLTRTYQVSAARKLAQNILRVLAQTKLGKQTVGLRPTRTSCLGKQEGSYFPQQQGRPERSGS